MHKIKILLTYYLNISVQAANLSDCRIKSNRKNRFGTENRIESKLFCPNWNALQHRTTPAGQILWGRDPCNPCGVDAYRCPQRGSGAKSLVGVWGKASEAEAEEYSQFQHKF